MAWTCKQCDKDHRGLPLDVAFSRPDAFLRLKESQRKAAPANDDLCSIHDKRFFVRGLLEVPVTDASETFGWGLWVEVPEAAFRRILDLWDDDNPAEPPFEGTIANTTKGYEDLEGQRVMVQLRGDGDRPALTLLPGDHLLYREQSAGITLHRVAEMWNLWRPQGFGR